MATRTMLTQNSNWYVSTTGSDSNGTGTENNPWATIQNAINVIKAEYDFGGFGATISVDDGTYTMPSGLNTFGAGTAANIGGIFFSIVGDSENPQNCILEVPPGNYGFSAGDYCWMYIDGFQFNGPATGNGSIFLLAKNYGGIDFGNCIFGQNGSTGGIDLFAINMGTIIATGNFSITGNSQIMYAAQQCGQINGGGVTVSIPNPLTFLQFAQATEMGFIVGSPGFTYTGAGVSGCVGQKANSSLNSVILVNGNNNAFPGNGGYATSSGGLIA